MLLRCALELESVEHQEAQLCLADAKRLIDHLRIYQEAYNWDLGDICLAQCETVVTRIIERYESNREVEDFMNSLGEGLAGGDVLFPDVWDMFSI